MLIFGQLIFAAILCALPFGYFGLWWYIGTIIYLSIANIMMLYSWRKAAKAYLKAVNMDISDDGFRIREGVKKLFNKDQPHPLVLCMIIVYAPLGGIMLLLFLSANRFLLRRYISRYKEKPSDTTEKKINLLWLEDLRDNGLFRTKL